MIKITDVKVLFPPGKRSVITVELNRNLHDERNSFIYQAKYMEDFKAWIYRADCGEFISCMCEPPRDKILDMSKLIRLKMADGWHGVYKPVATNGPAVNLAFPQLDPVIDVQLARQDAATGHVSALALARILALSGERVALAAVQWENGIRAYEALQDRGEATVPNMPGDTILYMQTAGNPLARLH